MRYIECSAITGENLKNVFEEAIQVGIDPEAKINDKDMTPNKGTSVYQVGKRKFARVTIS